MKSKILLVGLLCSLSARADTLATQIESFIKSKFNDNAVQVKVLVRTPPAQYCRVNYRSCRCRPMRESAAISASPPAAGRSGDLFRPRCRYLAVIWRRRAVLAAERR